jgi:hypothetical protein
VRRLKSKILSIQMCDMLKDFGEDRVRTKRGRQRVTDVKVLDFLLKPGADKGRK